MPLQTDKRPSAFVLLSLGANLGSRRSTIYTAVEKLTKYGYLSNSVLSSFYSTQPVGFSKQPDFINTAVSGLTAYPPAEFLHACKNIEEMLGRKARAKWHEREIDIDIILYDNVIFKDETILIPHPRMHLRRFVLEPAAEIAADAIHPVFLKTVAQLLDECTDNSAVKRI